MIKKSDLYSTPPEVFKMLSEKYGPFTWDLCATKETSKCGIKNYFGPDHANPKLRDALSNRLHAKYTYWCNPPYSNPSVWVRMAAYEALVGGCKIAMLLPADTSTRWFHDYIYNNHYCKYEFLKGRVRFLYNGERQGSPKFGSIVARFGY